MNVTITTFTNPFSFHCLLKETDNTFNIPEQSNARGSVSVQSKTEWTDVNHGQYIAVWLNNKWTRGVISMESQVLIWLVDGGYYLRPEENTIYVELLAEYKKLPSKVFEASIHGVVPVDKILNSDCEIENVISNLWNSGAINTGRNLIHSSRTKYFVPLALVSTKGNDVVLGDLYLDLPGEGVVNFIDKMEIWPVFLQRNPTAYLEGMTRFYTTRRKHHACLLKPNIPELPVTDTKLSLKAYTTLVDKAPKLELESSTSSEEDGSSIVDVVCSKKVHLTPAEIEEYANMYIKVNGREYNVLNVIINKTRDLIMCEKYKDRASVGRGISRWQMKELKNYNFQFKDQEEYS